jgi:hypothetical protein
MPDDRDILRTLGNVCILADTWIKQDTPKLYSVEPGSDEAYYMLVAMCFDLARKMQWLFEVTYGFGPFADPKVAKQLRDDSERINAQGLSWEQRAERVERIVLKRYERIGPKYKKLLQDILEEK